MKQSPQFLIPFGILLAAAPMAVSAHFRLLEPASWLTEDTRGDPQKSGSCGGTNADWGKFVERVGYDGVARQISIRFRPDAIKTGEEATV